MNRYLFIVGIIAVVLLAVFYLRSDFKTAFFGQKQRVAKLLECKTKLIDESVLSAYKKQGDPIRLLLHFQEKPSFDVRDFLSENGIAINLNSWVQDFLVADTTTDRLCFLESLPGITLISLGE